MSDDQIDWERLDRFVRGAGSLSERAELTRWVDDDPKRRALAEAMRTVGATAPGRGPRFDAARALTRLQPLTPPPRRPRKLQLTRLSETRRSRFVRRSMLVAGVAVAVAAGDALSRMAANARSESESASREIITAAGQ